LCALLSRPAHAALRGVWCVEEGAHLARPWLMLRRRDDRGSHRPSDRARGDWGRGAHRVWCRSGGSCRGLGRIGSRGSRCLGRRYGRHSQATTTHATHSRRHTVDVGALRAGRRQGLSRWLHGLQGGRDGLSIRRGWLRKRWGCLYGSSRGRGGRGRGAGGVRGANDRRRNYRGERTAAHTTSRGGDGVEEGALGAGGGPSSRRGARGLLILGGRLGGRVLMVCCLVLGRRTGVRRGRRRGRDWLRGWRRAVRSLLG
jgi:hypothetical protein